MDLQPSGKAAEGPAFRAQFDESVDYLIVFHWEEGAGPPWPGFGAAGAAGGSRRDSGGGRDAENAERGMGRKPPRFAGIKDKVWRGRCPPTP